jgi:hypothetical protein
MKNESIATIANDNFKCDLPQTTEQNSIFAGNNLLNSRQYNQGNSKFLFSGISQSNQEQIPNS